LPFDQRRTRTFVLEASDLTVSYPRRRSGDSLESLIVSVDPSRGVFSVNSK
jgi:hypothetical protein